ncbi:uncharacterized protein si:dkey-9i23.6 [Polypterus senegalus]|uniref:uncharacterized protein si:dkey-9i23.6 n=1 Tax=Polypterus senegalus TaxID=55291 RepID=UPI001964B44E|nr:uncharacterized protein si:dkey-9i23.6 [Polypterus senegalus]
MEEKQNENKRQKEAASKAESSMAPWGLKYRGIGGLTSPKMLSAAPFTLLKSKKEEHEGDLPSVTTLKSYPEIAESLVEKVPTSSEFLNFSASPDEPVPTSPSQAKRAEADVPGRISLNGGGFLLTPPAQNPDISPLVEQDVPSIPANQEMRSGDEAPQIQDQAKPVDTQGSELTLTFGEKRTSFTTEEHQPSPVKEQTNPESHANFPVVLKEEPVSKVDEHEGVQSEEELERKDGDREKEEEEEEEYVQKEGHIEGEQEEMVEEYDKKYAEDGFISQPLAELKNVDQRNFHLPDTVIGSDSVIKRGTEESSEMAAEVGKTALETIGGEQTSLTQNGSKGFEGISSHDGLFQRCDTVHLPKPEHVTGQEQSLQGIKTKHPPIMSENEGLLNLEPLDQKDHYLSEMQTINKAEAKPLAEDQESLMDPKAFIQTEDERMQFSDEKKLLTVDTEELDTLEVQPLNQGDVQVHSSVIEEQDLVGTRIFDQKEVQSSVLREEGFQSMEVLEQKMAQSPVTSDQSFGDFEALNDRKAQSSILEKKGLINLEPQLKNEIQLLAVEKQSLVDLDIVDQREFDVPASSKQTLLDLERANQKRIQSDRQIDLVCFDQNDFDSNVTEKQSLVDLELLDKKQSYPPITEKHTLVNLETFHQMESQPLVTETNISESLEPPYQTKSQSPVTEKPESLVQKEISLQSLIDFELTDQKFSFQEEHSCIDMKPIDQNKLHSTDTQKQSILELESLGEGDIRDLAPKKHILSNSENSIIEQQSLLDMECGNQKVTEKHNLLDLLEPLDATEVQSPVKEHNLVDFEPVDQKEHLVVMEPLNQTEFQAPVMEESPLLNLGNLEHSNIQSPFKQRSLVQLDGTKLKPLDPLDSEPLGQTDFQADKVSLMDLENLEPMKIQPQVSNAQSWVDLEPASHTHSPSHMREKDHLEDIEHQDHMKVQFPVVDNGVLVELEDQGEDVDQLSFIREQSLLDVKAVDEKYHPIVEEKESAREQNVESLTESKHLLKTEFHSIVKEESGDVNQKESSFISIDEGAEEVRDGSPVECCTDVDLQFASLGQKVKDLNEEGLRLSAESFSDPDVKPNTLNHSLITEETSIHDSSHVSPLDVQETDLYHPSHKTAIESDGRRESDQNPILSNTVVGLQRDLDRRAVTGESNLGNDVTNGTRDVFGETTLENVRDSNFGSTFGSQQNNEDKYMDVEFMDENCMDREISTPSSAMSTSRDTHGIFPFKEGSICPSIVGEAHPKLSEGPSDIDFKHRLMEESDMKTPEVEVKSSNQESGIEVLQSSQSGPLVSEQDSYYHTPQKLVKEVADPPVDIGTSVAVCNLDKPAQELENKEEKVEEAEERRELEEDEKASIQHQTSSSIKPLLEEQAENNRESSSPAIEAMVPDGRWSEMEVPSNTSTPPAPPPASSKPKHFSSGSDSLNFDPGLSPINLVDELFVGDDWSQFLPEKKELVSVKSCPAVAEEKEEEEEEETLGPDTTDQSFHGIPEYEMKRSRSGSSCSSDHPQSLEVDESEQSPLEDLEGMKQEPSEMEEEREANTDDEEGEEEERSSMDHIPDPEADNNQSETLIETMEDTSHPEEEEEILSPVSPDAEVTPSLPPLDLSSIERSEMLDNSVYRNRANLNRKRGHRAPVQVPRNCREDREAENESDWMFRDSTEPRAAAEAAPTNNDDENGDEGDGRDVKCARLESSPVKGSPARSPISPAGRVQLFPGVDASTLQEKLKFPKKSGDACDAASSEKAGASDEDALSPSKTSPGGKTKLGKFPGFSKDIFKRVLPKKAAKTEGAETAASNWLQVLKMKKKNPK